MSSISVLPGIHIGSYTIPRDLGPNDPYFCGGTMFLRI